MKKVLLTLALALLTASPAPAAVISFDTAPNGAGGTLTYDGAGGPAIGTDISFTTITGLGTAQNDGLLLSCVGCLLDFTTGANLGEGPTYVWAGGGSFELTGSVPFLGLNNVTLLSGTFTGTTNTPGFAAGDISGFFLGLGTDTKHEFLTGFYGESPDNWAFANTEIALQSLTVDPVTGAFSAVPNQADIINVTAIPEPATMLLLGTGLVGMGWVGKRRLKHAA